jgi:hypothetical protein
VNRVPGRSLLSLGLLVRVLDPDHPANVGQVGTGNGVLSTAGTGLGVGRALVVVRVVLGGAAATATRAFLSAAATTRAHRDAEVFRMGQGQIICK